MSKVICDVCGTSYPDTATQCPICGCVRPGEAKSVKGNNSDGMNGDYNYVKGGRFSKSNVRKRNKNSGAFHCASEPNPSKNEPEEKDNKGLVIAAIVLLLAVVAVLVYISVQFFLPQEPDESTKQTSQSDSTASSTLEIPCESLKLDTTQFIFDKADISRIIYPTAEPKNTTDKFIFESSDESVVTIDQNGLVTPVGRGQATITVTCGDAVAHCTVECTFELPNDESSDPGSGDDPVVPDEEFRLNREDITFTYKGESWVLYGGEVDMSLIAWESDDETVAAISSGKVVAVGNGQTVVYATYNDKTVSCIIRCSFSDDSNSGSSGNVTEDGSGDTGDGTYKLKNIYGGRTDDVSLKVDESFIMQLVDSNGKKVQGVTWTASDEAICTVADGTVTAIGKGITTVTASYQGVEYSFTLRVN